MSEEQELKLVRDIKEHNQKQWTRFFSIAVVVFTAMLAIGAVQLRMSTKNSVLINQLLRDEHMAVDYATWYRYNMVTNFELKALSSFLDGNEKEFMEVMNEFERFKSQITRTYQLQQEDKYRGIVMKPED